MNEGDEYEYEDTDEPEAIEDNNDEDVEDEQNDDQELDEYIIDAINNITQDDDDSKLTETSGSVTQRLKNTKCHQTKKTQMKTMTKRKKL